MERGIIVLLDIRRLCNQALPFFNAVIFVFALQSNMCFATDHSDLIDPNKNFVLSEQEKQFIQSLPPLRVMIDDNFVPLSSYNSKVGTFEGLSVDLFRHAAAQLGLKYQLLHDAKLSWADKVELFKKQQIDLLMPTSYTEERSKYGVFTNSFYNTYYGAIIKKSSKTRIKYTHDLALYKVGVTKSSSIIPFIQSTLPDARITYYANQTDLYQAVRTGEIDVALQNRNVFHDDRFKLGFVDLVMPHIIVEYPRRYSYFLNKTEPYQKLVAIIDRYLVGAEYSRLVAEYERGEDDLILKYNEQKNQKKQLILGIAGSLTLLAMLGVVYLNHRRFTAKLAASLQQLQQQQLMLQKSEEKYRGLFDNSRDALITLEPPSWKFGTCNHAALELFRVNDEKLFISNGPSDFSPELQPDGRPSIEKSSEMMEIAQRDGYHLFEWAHRRISGEVFPAEVFLARVEDGERVVLLATVRDITERKQAETENRRLEQQFQHAQKLESLGVLAGGIAHDFNNILLVILGHCYLASENSGPEYDYKATFHKIETAGNRAADLCRQMLAYAGKSPMVQTRIDLKQVVDEVVTMLKAAIMKTVEIEMNLQFSVPDIKGDVSQIQQVIMNLIINAAEAIGDGKGSIKVALTTDFLEADGADRDTFGTPITHGSYTCLEVTDTGCGMDEETQKRIFEPFYTTKSTGRGLGMSAIGGIIKSHGGILQLNSAPGTGTTFKVYFPVTDSSEVTGSGTKVEADFVNKGGKVLLVEDEEALRTMGVVLLETLGFSALSACDGREALEVYRGQADEINLILLDLVMPEMGGIEAYRELRATNPEVPIIFCSGYSIESVSEIIENDPNACFTHKPYKPSELRDTILRMLK
jgi:PAS domain S-box-containing protein